MSRWGSWPCLVLLRDLFWVSPALSCTSLAIAPASLCNSLPTRRYHRLLEINLQLHRHPRQCCWPPILVPSLSSFRCLEWSILGDPVLQLIKNYAVIKHMRSCIKANKTHDCQFRGSLSPLQWLTVTVTSIGITGWQLLRTAESCGILRDGMWDQP